MIQNVTTQEMIDHYRNRTNKHISLVKKMFDKLADRHPPLVCYINKVKNHDSNKFEEPDYTPYIWITWRYKCKDDGVNIEFTPEQEDRMRKATFHHIITNSHHPEFHIKGFQDNIDPKNRDKALTVIDIPEMPKEDVAEMVSDWAAMSIERGGTPREWYDKVKTSRWNFSPQTHKYIDIFLKTLGH